MKQRYLSVIALSLAATLAIASPLAFAKDNGKGNDNSKSHVVASSFRQNGDGDSENDDQGDQNENANSTTTNQGCFRAFGHLIAPGWIKHNGPVDVSIECPLPFGIGRIFGRGGEGDHGHGTTTPPVVSTTTPVSITVGASISNVRAHSAAVSWTTNVNADSEAWISTTSPVNTSSSANIIRANLVANHRLNLNGLASSTTYYVIVSSKDASGNVATSSQVSFTTTAGAPVATTTAPLSITSAVASIGSASANMTWSTNASADSEVYLSTTSPVTIGATSTLAFINSSLVTSHSISATGLATSTTYFALIRSVDASSNVASTAQFSFTTGM